VFRCTTRAGRLQPTGEADRHAWFALDQLPAATSRRQTPRLHDALTATGPALREQRGTATGDSATSSPRPVAWSAAHCTATLYCWLYHRRTRLHIDQEWR